MGISSCFFQATDARISSLSQGFTSRLLNSISEGRQFSETASALRVNESELVHSILLMLQGFSSSLIYWDGKMEFCFKTGIHLSHLSQAGLYGILDRFIFAGTCLKIVELFVKKVDTSHDAIPTLRAFAACVSSWLERLRAISLKVEIHSTGSCIEATTTLLQLGSSLSSVCSGAEYLLKIVYGAIPCAYFDLKTSFSTYEFATYILDHLFLKLSEASLVEGSEEEEYHMLVAIFTGTILPYINGLQSWLCDGILDDPYNELFFFADPMVSIDQPEFWEKSYVFRRQQHRTSPGASLLLSEQKSTICDKGESVEKKSGYASSGGRGTGQNNMDGTVCPSFLKDIARDIVSAGKSLQLVGHVRDNDFAIIDGYSENAIDCVAKQPTFASPLQNMINEEYVPRFSNTQRSQDERNIDECDHGIEAYLQRVLANKGMWMLTLSEIFLLSLVGLIEDGQNIHEYLAKPCPFPQEVVRTCLHDWQSETEAIGNAQEGTHGKWSAFMFDVIKKKVRLGDLYLMTNEDCSEKSKGNGNHFQRLKDDNFKMNQGSISPDNCPQNPTLSLNKKFLLKNKGFWNDLNISRNFHLPPLNDGNTWNSLFGEKHGNLRQTPYLLNTESFCRLNWTNFMLKSKFGVYEEVYLQDDVKTIESLLPFPTLLPYFQENALISGFFPYQKNSTLASSILHWIQSSKPKTTPLPTVIVQQCLALYIKNQVNHIGRHILFKLMNEWKLMDELGVLRAIYLLGSGDLLQQFLMVIFGKLDKGDSLDDDFELNTLLQASIRNSADSRILSTPDSFVVSVAKHNVPDDGIHMSGISPTSRKLHNLSFNIDALNLLKFTYKVSWPLDLIIKVEAIKKYNQVMCFLLKVKYAKFALDKAQMWMWKCRGRMTQNHKHRLLVQQKLLHFVDAFHQYVMDRVFHSAWLQLCNGMESASSLDEVIEVHEAYLFSIQHQCFVAPDKLWALIASRIKVILGLALDFYSVQKTLVSGGAASAIKARCKMEVDRIEKRFDDCISFLLRILSVKPNVGHFPHLADLMTRINYNHFYMSDSGNLLTVQNFEISSNKSTKPIRV